MVGKAKKNLDVQKKKLKPKKEIKRKDTMKFLIHYQEVMVQKKSIDYNIETFTRFSETESVYFYCRFKNEINKNINRISRFDK